MPERKIEYQVLEHKADTGFTLSAPSLQRLYIDAGLAFTDMMVKLDQIEEKDKRNVQVTGENLQGLMVKWLTELLHAFDVHKFLCRRIVFNHFDGKTISATLHGETYVPLRHGHVSEIKAITYHQLEVGQRGEAETEFFARVFLDL